MNKIRKEFLLEGLDCDHCASKIGARVNGLEGVKEASVDFSTKTLVIEFEAESISERVISQAKEIINDLEPDVVVKEKL